MLYHAIKMKSMQWTHLIEADHVTKTALDFFNVWQFRGEIKRFLVRSETWVAVSIILTATTKRSLGFVFHGVFLR